MEAVLLNAGLESIGYLDTFQSFLWIDRFNEAGEFEILESPRTNVLTSLSQAQYVLFEESDHVMVIESLNIHTDPKEGNQLFIKGKSLESILERRVVWDPITLSGNLQTGIQTLLNDNAITPTNTDRDITLLEFPASTDANITSLTMDEQYLGETLYEAISGLCIANGIGFKIILTALGKFQFQLYSGTDRSYSQSVNPYVVFSPNFDNLVNGDYSISSEFMKNVALVGGEAGVGNIRTFTNVELPTGVSDLARREVFVDASSIGRTLYGTEAPLTESEYLLVLQSKGYEELANKVMLEVFDGQLEIGGNYVYDEDFFMGDVIQVANEFGHEAKSRVIEMLYFQDPARVNRIPRFVAV